MRFGLFVLLFACACARGEPPGADAARAPSASSAAATDCAADAAGAIDAASMTRATDAGDAVADAFAAPADAAPAIDPATLPQTRDKPEASGAAFDARVAALWSAIVSDEPERGKPFFFPLPAYEQVKAIQNPAADWKRRLVAAYAHDIHAMHAKLGGDPARARFVRFDAGPAPRWVEPGEEYNKIGYYRVFASKLRFERADGKSDAIDVKSLISWRGEWYVVHLGAIK